MNTQQPALSISTRIIRNAIEKATVVDLKGTIDHMTAPQLKDALADLVHQGNYHIVVNMSCVEYLDSSGLGSLISGYKRVREHHGTLSIASPSEVVSRLLDLTRLNMVFHVYTGELWALEAIPRVSR